MDYCGPAGIPRSHFLGGPHVWTVSDREWALSWQSKQRRTCSGCGTRPEEWNPGEGGDRLAFEFLPGVCPGCEQKERVEENMRGPEWEGQRGKTLNVRKRA